MRSGRILSALAIATALGLAATSAPHAQAVSGVVVRGAPLAPGAEVKNESVKYADLDLTKAEGAETLVGRIRAAATRVCHPQPTTLRDFKDVSDYEKCHQQAVRGAVQGLGNPVVQKVLDRTGD